MYDLSGKVAVITGAASGMGQAAAVLFAQHGAHVVLADLNAKGGEAAAAEASAAGPKCVFQRADVSQEADVKAMIDRAVSEFGKLDILFNNAGIGEPNPSPLHQFSTEDWLTVIAVDLHGVFFCAREALKIMVEQGNGKIINIASIWGLAGSSSLFPVPAYNTAKGAVVNLTRELGLEYATSGIQVNALCPGFYYTRLGGGSYDNPDVVALLNAFIPMGRIAAAEEIRGPALFLASHASDYMTGQTLVVDGGCLAK